MEDDKKVRKLTRRILEQNGYTVLAAQNGEDAIKMSKKYDGRQGSRKTNKAASTSNEGN